MNFHCHYITYLHWIFEEKKYFAQYEDNLFPILHFFTIDSKLSEFNLKNTHFNLENSNFNLKNSNFNLINTHFNFKYSHFNLKNRHFNLK